VKQTTVALSIFLLCLNSGCRITKLKKLEVNNVPHLQQERIVGITTRKGDEIRFDAPGAYVKGNLIEAYVKNVPYSIALQDVQRLWIEYRGISTARTIGITVGIVAGTLIVFAAIVYVTKQSCPFVYSWDGTQYVFDAEPYGGAITRGLERDDFSELEHLCEQNGLYRILLTNEVDETQYTNLMELWVVDHDRGARVVTDENGSLHAYTKIQKLSAAHDGYGNDLLQWLQSTDDKIWEPEAISGPDGILRQEVILTFHKKEGSEQANLIANAATGLWGSYMVKKMVELHGRESANWLASLDKDSQAVKAIQSWEEREGTYRLPIEVEEPTGWEIRGSLPHGGPLLAEDRVIPLDIHRVRGSDLRIRLRPPVGFWAFNSFSVAYGTGQEVIVTPIAPISATTFEGKDILEDLTQNDNRYYSMPYSTDRAAITFKSPIRKPETERTVFLHSRGWYQLHLRDNSEPDLTTFNRIMSIPNAAAQFAVDRFAHWQLDRRAHNE
jgi:hypothetical protein